MRIFFRIFQYIILCMLVIDFSELFNDSTIGFIIRLFVLLTLVALHLKWMSRYPVSYPGMYFINGMLTVMSICILMKFLIVITGRNTFSANEGWIIVIICIAPIFIWWNFNVIEWMNKINIPRVEIIDINNTSKEKVVKSEQPSGRLKLAQYSLLFVLTFSFVISIALYRGISSLLIYLVMIVFIGLTLKWISRYPVSSGGVFLVNGALSVISIIIVLRLYIAFVVGRFFADTEEGMILILVSIIPIFLWWKLNVIGLFKETTKE